MLHSAVRLCVWFDLQVCVSRKNSRLTVLAEFSDHTLSCWSNTWQVERDASVRQWGIRATVPSSVILEQMPSPLLVETVATAGTLTSHANFNGTCALTAGTKLSISFAL